MTNDPDLETRNRTDGELAEALYERDAARAQRDRTHAENDKLAIELGRARAALRDTEANRTAVIAAWKADDVGSLDSRAAAVILALAKVAGIEP